MNKLDFALGFATHAHKDQVRKYTGEPYITHPIAVKDTLLKLQFHTDVLIAALLHDTVEDTDTTIQDIEEYFGTIVARLVEDLTDVYTSRALPHLNRKERKRLECARLGGVSSYAQSIKLADLIDNTPSIVLGDAGFAKIYLEEKEEMLKVLIKGSLELQDRAYKALTFGKKQIHERVI